jgi:hypothetical protein
MGEAGWVRWLLIVALFLYHLAYFDTNLNMYDEGLIVEGALQTIEGRLVFREFCHLSTQYGLVAGLFRVFGQNLLVFRGLLLLLRVAIGMMVFHLGKRVGGYLAAITALLLVITNSGPWHKTFVPFFLVLNLYLLVAWLDERRRIRLVFAGVGTGIAAGIHVYTALANLLATGAALLLLPRVWGGSSSWRTRLRGMGWYLAAFVVALLVFGHSLLWEDWLDWLDRTLHVLRSDYFGYQDLLGGWLSGAAPRSLRGLLRAGLLDLPWILPLLVLGLRRRLAPQESGPLIIVALFSLTHYAKVLARFDHPHLYQNFAPAALLLAWLAAQPLRSARLRGTTAGARGILVLGLAAQLLAGAIFVDALWTRDYYRGSIGILLERDLVRLPFRVAPLRVPYEEARELSALVQFVREHTRPEQKILAVPECPMFYFLTGRRNPTSLSLFDRPESFYGAEESAVLAEIAAADVGLCIVHDVVPDGLERNRFEVVAPLIAEYVRTRFRLAARFGNYEVWLPRE